MVFILNSIVYVYVFVPLQIFSKEQEEELVAYVLKCSNLMYGLHIRDLKKLAYSFAKEINVKYPSQWDTHRRAGEDWYLAFMKRHRNLSLRTPEQTSLNRAKGFNRSSVQAFFGLYDEVLSLHHYAAVDIYNIDESGFSTVPSKLEKVLAERGSKHVGMMTSQERGTMITLALAINAAGDFVPPFFVFPVKKLQSSFLDHASPGADGLANGSGWMKGPDFVVFLKHFVKYSHATKQTPKVLLLDNHISHLFIDGLHYASENGVTLLTFPPHCSHRMQPLDGGVFAAVKESYMVQCDAWMKNHGGNPLAIRNLPEIIATSLDIGATRKNIKSAFRSTGVWPYNPEIFQEFDFVMAAVRDFEHDVPAHEEVTTSDHPTTSVEESTRRSRSTSALSDILDSIGPVQMETPPPKSNRGRKPGRSSILCAPEVAKKKRGRPAKKGTADSVPVASASAPKNRGRPPTKTAPATQKKRGRPSLKSKKPKEVSISSDDDEDMDFCTICFENMPKTLTRFNSIACDGCRREVHLKCANMRAGYYTCRLCDDD